MELTIRNFKAVEALDLVLSDFAVFQGPNGSGKTTILQAYKLAVEGKLPGISDKDLFAELARESEDVNSMSVGLKTDDYSFTRYWHCNEKFDNKLGKRVSTVSQSIDITPFISGENTTQKKERIKKLISLNPISVDFGKFLNLSDSKRRDFFYELGGKTEKLTEDKILGCLAFSSNVPAERLKDFDFFSQQTGEPDLNMILNNLAQKISGKNAEKLQCEAVTRSMIEIKAARETVGGHLKDLEGSLKDLQKQKADLEKDIETNASKATVVRLTDERKQEYTDRQIVLEKAVSEDAQTLIDLMNGIKELEEKVSESTKSYEKEKAKLEKFQKKADKKLTDLEQARQAIRLEIAKKQGEGDSVVASLEAHGQHLSKESLEYLKGKRNKIKKDTKEEDKTLSALHIQAEELMIDAEETATNIFNLSTAHNKETVEFSGTSASLSKQLDMIEAGIPKQEQELVKIKEAVEVSDKLPPPEEVVAVSVLKDRLEGINGSILELEPSVRGKQREMELLVVQVDAESNLKSAELDLFYLKAMQKALGPSGLKGELVKATLGPIYEKVNKALEILGYAKEFDFQTVDSRGNECFNFGWKNDTGRLIKFNALSAGEQTVLLTALVAVICSESEGDVKMLAMDNIEVISSDHEEGYFRGLYQLAKLCELDLFWIFTSKKFNLEDIDPKRKYLPDSWQFYLCPLEE